MRFYTLNDIVSQTRLAAPAMVAPVKLTHINIPAELDRRQLVLRLDANQLQISYNPVPIRGAAAIPVDTVTVDLKNHTLA